MPPETRSGDVNRVWAMLCLHPRPLLARRLPPCLAQPSASCHRAFGRSVDVRALMMSQCRTKRKREVAQVAGLVAARLVAARVILAVLVMRTLLQMSALQRSP